MTKRSSRVLYTQLVRPSVIAGWLVMTAWPSWSAEAVPEVATVAYQGSYTGEVVTQIRNSSRSTPDPLKALSDPLSLMGSMGKTPTPSRGNGQDMFGAMEVSLSFNGPSVSGTVKTTGTLRSTKVSGVRQGDMCKLVFSRTLNFEGECSQARFAGEIRSSEDGRRVTTIQVDAPVTQLVDVAARNQEQEAARAQRAQQAASAEAERKRAEEAEMARQAEILRALPPVRK